MINWLVWLTPTISFNLCKLHKELMHAASSLSGWFLLFLRAWYRYLLSAYPVIPSWNWLWSHRIPSRINPNHQPNLSKCNSFPFLDWCQEVSDKSKDIQSLVLVGQHIHFVCRMRSFFLCFSRICCSDPLFCLHLVCKHPHFAGWSRSSLFVDISSFVGCNRLLCRLLLRFCWLSNVPIISWKPSCRAPGLPSDPNGRDDCGLEHLHLPTPDFFAPKQEDIQALASRRGNLRWQWSSWSYQGPVDGEVILE